MLYPFLTAPDDTEISYSEILHPDHNPEVRVFVEKWDEERKAFDSRQLLATEVASLGELSYPNLLR